MERREIDGRPATDRAGACELGGVSMATINLRAAPSKRAESGFPAPLDRQDGRDWYAIDDLTAHFAAEKERKAASTEPKPVPDWLLDGDPDDLLPSKDFRRAIGVSQGAWKYYVQISQDDWAKQQDGYLPLPDDDEDYRGRGKIYYWKRHRIIQWLRDRPGLGAGAGRTGGAQPTIDDAVAAVRAASGSISGAQLADTLDIDRPRAYYLLRKARERLAAEAQ
ncbi:hypothetical protein AB0M46_13580 [Dactylosporangium sp. NPDC051485]|uniref:hypothetical protein n=1 Tax=Dactylosporangium sp. NPDC051485 TaxID=3154846 RepID=UPI00342F6BB0